jgi:hypothetical protein
MSTNLETFEFGLTDLGTMNGRSMNCFGFERTWINLTITYITEILDFSWSELALI